MKTKILIIEDDSNLLEALKITLSKQGYDIYALEEPEQAIEVMNQYHFNLIILDVNLGKMNGIDLLTKIKQHQQLVPVIMMTAFGLIKDAVKAIQLGAVDYITKPFEIDMLREKIEKFKYDNEPCKTQGVFLAKKSQKILELAQLVAKSDASVLICGESGTGKEIIARHIHACSSRKLFPFVAINCAAIPDNMLEALLFGFEKGAFTGAINTSEGKFEQANKGTLLLDEISEMPMGLQAKLLRVLQEREVEKLGGKKVIKLDIRFIATTNRDLAVEIEDGRFREDLFFRLNVFPIKMPALREVKENIIPLSYFFLKKSSVSQRNLEISLEAKNKLISYHWPGNIRELSNVIQRASILAKNCEIVAQDIVFDDINSNEVKNVEDLSSQLLDKENELILKTLTEFNGNRSESAKKLGISERTLRNKVSRLRKHGIEIPF